MDSKPEVVERKDVEHQDDAYRQGSKVDVHQSEVLADSDLMNDAVDGENREHAQGLWAAVKTHPMACIWAFIFCFTIVSSITFPATWVTLLDKATAHA